MDKKQVNQDKNTKNPFIEMEKKWLEYWYGRNIVQKYLTKNITSNKRFSFLDGPITANNPMGVHHGWGRTYKDVWQKFYNLLGYRQRFQSGFDCQGLWVEVEVEKELGIKNKKEIENLVPGDHQASIAKFVELCKQRVKKYSQIQTEQSKRLGYIMDWEHSYYTMSPENNYMIWQFLRVCYDNGWIYKGRESVPWCPRCETAISQHEILTEDYKEISHESVIIRFPIIDRPNEYLLVWTTTPWTIPANIAIAVDPKIKYVLVEVESVNYWIAEPTIESVLKDKSKKIINSVIGEKLVGLRYRGPFDDLPAVSKIARENPDTFHTVVATDAKIMPILTMEGTGLVHTAVSAGTEDFLLGRKLGLPMVPVIDDNADYLPTMGWLAGKNAKNNPRIILDYLENQKFNDISWSFRIFSYKHRYPACWRCKTELVWKVADEWYIAMDKPSKLDSNGAQTLRQRMIKVAKNIHWLPEFGLDRELDWLKNMRDWLISKKNRYWGLALPIYECSCGHFEVIGSKEELEKRAIRGWDDFKGKTPHKPYIDNITIQCSKCGHEVWRIPDVGNPWLDAGIVPFSTISENNQGEPLYKINRKKWQEWFPVDFITESFPGQFKNWFYSLIAMATVLENTHPFKTVLGFGTLLGEDGRPMHKSWGNSIAFQEGADNIGVDVMRWMYCRHNPAENLLFGYNRANEIRRLFYLLLWNIFKFYLDYRQIDKIKINHNSISLQKSLSVLDQWIISRFIVAANNVYEFLKNYQIRETTSEIELLVNDLSTWYLRRSRNRVGFHSDNLSDKKAFYSTLHSVLVNLSIIISPIMPFISEEIYTTLTNKESVLLSTWPKITTKPNYKLLADMATIRQLAEVGHRERKKLQIKLRQPLASATISLPATVYFQQTNKVSDYLTLLVDELNVKKIFLSKTKNNIVDVTYDTKITSTLRLEGELREMIRSIQAWRKRKGISINQKIRVIVPVKFSPYIDYIKRTVQAESLSLGNELKIDLIS